MCPTKAPRIEKVLRQLPVLKFTITRHPGWNRIQRWSYDFSTNRPTLVCEQGEIRSGRYTVDDVNQNASAILQAMLHGRTHSCVKRADGLTKVALNKLSVTRAVPHKLPVRKAKGLQERLRARVAELIHTHPEYHRIPLVESRSTLMYRDSSTASPETAHPTRSRV